MGHYTSIRGWLDLSEEMVEPVKNKIAWFKNGEYAKFGLSKEVAELYARGWVSREGHLNWSEYVFFGGDVRTETVPYFEALLREISKISVQDGEFTDFPLGVFHVDSEDLTNTVIWYISNGQFKQETVKFILGLTMEQFVERAEVLLEDEAVQIRERYIEFFINTEGERYKETILQKKQFSDGLFYVGYLWENLKKLSPISKGEAIEKISSKKGALYVMWDLHSPAHFTGSHFIFQIDAVLTLSASDLTAGLDFLPLDIYIFDATFSWSIILTHEGWGNQERYCLEAIDK